MCYTVLNANVTTKMTHQLAKHRLLHSPSLSFLLNCSKESDFETALQNT